MARLLALEWDLAEARVAVGRVRAGALVLEQAFTVDLPQRKEGGPAVTEAEIGAKIAQAINERGLSRGGDALVAVGRTSIELRFLTTPPVPPEELPDLVRLQAIRQFGTLGEDWSLDFVPLDNNKDGGLNVLAAAISPELVAQIHTTCAAAQLPCKRLVLRPFAAAALLRKLAADGRCRMMIDCLGDEADLTVLAGEKVVFPRTVRLPSASSGDQQARALLGEVRRTMIAAQNQLGGRKVEQLVFFGDSAHHAALKQLLQSELSLDQGVELINPFAGIEQTDELKNRPPTNPGTFAPLIGMLLDEAASLPPGIDFLHPRKKPQPANRARLYGLAGGAIAVAALALVWLIMMQLWSLDSQIKTLTKDLADKEKTVKQGKLVRDQTAKLDQFLAADVNWLEELRAVSEKAPPPNEIRVNGLFASAKPKGGGTVTLEAVASDPAKIHELENALRDANHVVQGSGGKKDDKLTGLTWRFREAIDVTVPDPSDAALPATKPVSTPAKRSAAAKKTAATKAAVPATNEATAKLPGGRS